jgi:hypothetical protein
LVAFPWNINDNTWGATVILDVRVIRSLILDVERIREIFHIHTQRYQLNVRSDTIDWVCKEAAYREEAAGNVTPGMSGACDWALKEVLFIFFLCFLFFLEEVGECCSISQEGFVKSSEKDNYLR